MPKILIIEDEPDMAETIKMFVEREGFSAESTTDAMAGIEKLQSFDVLLLDLIMPKMSGRAVLAEIKKRKLKTPVIVLSAVGLPVTVGEELRKAYPNVRFVPKTEMYTDLIPAIKSALKD